MSTPEPSFHAAAAGLALLPDLLAFVERRCAELGITGTSAYDAQLAAEEVYVNLVRHGYPEDTPGPVDVVLSRQDGNLIIEIRDRAPPFAPHEAPAPDLDSEAKYRAEGGLGLYLVRQVMSSVEYESDSEDGNRLTLRKRLDPRRPKGDEHDGHAQ